MNVGEGILFGRGMLNTVDGCMPHGAKKYSEIMGATTGEMRGEPKKGRVRD